MRPIALLLLLVGCTASKATIQIVNADDAVRRAREYDADRLAEYEYVMATRYLEKAKEKAGHSEFRMADALARQSAEWSDRAIIFVESRGRSELELEDFSEGTMSPSDQQGPAPAPEPTGLEDILAPTPAPPPPPAPEPVPDEWSMPAPVPEPLPEPLPEPFPDPAPAPEEDP